MSSKLERKRMAAAAALERVPQGCRLGLGCGSTVSEFIRLLGEKIRGGLSVRSIAACGGSEAAAREAGVPLESSEDLFPLDMVVDGADEIDGSLRLIKGGGGALLREKILASSAREFIVIAEGEKLVGQLGKFALPVEVSPFGASAILSRIRREAADVGCEGDVALRRNGGGEMFVSDGGHWICDCAFGRIPDTEALADRLDRIAGVMEHGLFLGMVDVVMLGEDDGVKVLHGGL